MWANAFEYVAFLVLILVPGEVLMRTPGQDGPAPYVPGLSDGMELALSEVVLLVGSWVGGLAGAACALLTVAVSSTVRWRGLSTPESLPYASTAVLGSTADM